ncbi:MAG: AMP-binding protein, partial [Oceanobacter sp.]
FEETGPETHAKYMLTSGSTGQPKIVAVTQRMMCSNQQMVAQCMPFIETTPPVVLEWLPWSHTFGTNHNFNLVLRNGGTFYVDEGRPMPGLVEKTAHNIKAVRPTLMFNVPKGFEALLPLIKSDEELAKAYFENLQMMFYAGAALSEPVWNEYKALAEQYGADVFMTTEWGSTETAPANTNVHWRLERAGNIGNPMPGVSIKLVPNSGKLEIRVKGPNVFREYLNEPVKTAEAFDKDSYYLIGDAGKLADPENPSAGILFDGRVSEDFKLSTGTWVCVATMRKRVVEAFDGLVSDALITGHNEDYIGLVVFPSPGIQKLAGDAKGEFSGAELVSNQVVHATFETALASINAQAKGSSQKIVKLLMADTPPSIDLGEVTDKGNLNQRKLLETRKDLVASLYSDNKSNAVIRA